MNSKKISVGVVFGGASGEHSVSIKSAKTVVNALNSNLNEQRFNVIPIYIDKEGKWYGSDVAMMVLNKGNELNKIGLEEKKKNHNCKFLPDEINKVDVFFPSLHGPNGEDGTIQGLFELMQKPYVGANVLGSAIGMDKLAMKAIFASSGLPQAAYIAANAISITDKKNRDILIKKCEEFIGYPCFVKPANLGSSVGISKAFKREELLKGLKEAYIYDTRIVIEKAINCRELECAIIGNDELIASQVGEIKFNADWYDYKTKYLTTESNQIIIPAEVNPNISNEIRRLSIEACEAISVKGMARVDFFYSTDTEEIFINEVNTLPGFTSQSMYPLLWEASGLNLEELVANLVTSAKKQLTPNQNQY